MPEEVNINNQIRKAFCVKLSNHELGVSFHQIYAGGPGFESITPEANKHYDVLTTYSDCPTYTFFQKDKTVKTLSDLPAMVCAKNRGRKYPKNSLQNTR